MQATIQLTDMPMETVFDVLLDDDYRKKWDKFMQSMKPIGYINEMSDIFYYSSRFWSSKYTKLSLPMRMFAVCKLKI